MNEYVPYTYLIGWSKLDRWYYGSEYGQIGKTANPKNLWTTYFTSSKEVSKLREKHGEPDVIQIRKTFKTADEALSWEHRVLHAIDISSERWLNNGRNLKNAFSGRRHTAATKEKMSQAALNRSTEHRAAISSSNRRRHITEATREKMRLAKKGKKLSPEHRAKIGQAGIGRVPWNKGLSVGC